MKVEPRKVQLDGLTGEPVTERQQQAIDFIKRWTGNRFNGQYKHEASAFIGTHLEKAIGYMHLATVEEDISAFFMDEMNMARAERNGRIW